MFAVPLHLSKIRKELHARLLRVVAFRSWDVYVWIVLVLLLIGGFLRLYKLSDSVMFLGDQGRDAIIVSRIFTDFDPVFIGPVTSVGNMYLGPLYYYFMLPFLWLSYPSPMGPVYAVAILNTLLIPLMYILGSRMVGKRAAIVATALLTMSSSAISLSRFSWNPNLMPLVGLIWFYCLYQAARGKRWYWLGVSVSLAILVQLHYITLLAVGVSGLVWLWRLLIEKRRGLWLDLVRPTLISVGIFAAFQIPLILFDMKHGWLNAQQFLKLFSGEDAFASEQSGLTRFIQVVEQSRLRFSQLFVGITFAISSNPAVLFAYTFVTAIVVFWSREKHSAVRQAIQLLLLTLLVSVAGLSVYKNVVYLHYLAFLLPLVFLLYGYLFDRLMKLSKLQIVVVGLAIFVYSWQNILAISFVGGGPRLPVLQATADAIHARVENNEPYSIVLISQSKDLYGMSYRYFLTTDQDKRPLEPERFELAKKMFVLWEDKDVAEPLKLPLYELLVFDVATPSATFDVVGGPTVLELRKN